MAMRWFWKFVKRKTSIITKYGIMKPSFRLDSMIFRISRVADHCQSETMWIRWRTVHVWQNNTEKLGFTPTHMDSSNFSWNPKSLSLPYLKKTILDDFLYFNKMLLTSLILYHCSYENQKQFFLCHQSWKCYKHRKNIQKAD